MSFFYFFALPFPPVPRSHPGGGKEKVEENGFHQMEINLFDYAAIWKKFR